MSKLDQELEDILRPHMNGEKLELVLVPQIKAVIQKEVEGAKYD